MVTLRLRGKRDGEYRRERRKRRGRRRRKHVRMTMDIGRMVIVAMAGDDADDGEGKRRAVERRRMVRDSQSIEYATTAFYARPRSPPRHIPLST